MGNTTANVLSIILLVAVVGAMAAYAGVTPADVGLSEEPATPTPTATPTATPTPTPTQTPTPEPAPIRDPDDPGPSSHTYYNGLHLNSTETEKAVLEETNRVRSSHDLEPLEWDSEIASVARAHSEDMYARGYVSHNNPEGQSSFQRYEDIRPDGCSDYSENILRFSSIAPEEVTVNDVAEDMVNGWMNSPPHRRAILESGMERIGIGIHIAEDGTIHAAQNFCTT